MLQAQVAGYTDEGLPEVYLYATLGPDVRINAVERNFGGKLILFLFISEHCFYQPGVGGPGPCHLVSGRG